MEALQRPIASIYRNESGEDEPDDSFFELELTSGDLILYPKISSPPSKQPTTQLTDKPKGRAFPSSGTVQAKQSTTSKTQMDPKFNFPQSKRKILPIESSFSRPQTPIPLLRSTPKFRDLMFTKSKPVSERTEGAELRRHKGRSFFTIKFKCRENGAAPTASCSDSPLPGTSSSKRFSKETIHKYLRLVKPLYVKVSSKRQCNGGTGEFSLSAGSAPAKFRVDACSCKQLGKSKSASGVASPVRRDESLLQQQHDGIESAILHCKRSFSSSRSSCDRVSIS